jgi:uncharacterized membrane protein
MRKSEIAVLGIILLSFAISVYFYPQLPEQMASHWNAAGEVNGYLPKLWGTFLLPVMLLAISLLFIAIPVIDPLKKNIEEFRKHYDVFVIIILLFMLSIQAFTLLWNIGIRVSPNFIIPIGIGILSFYLGVLCENAKRNWSIGIRTPWTMSSEKVWDKTHELGAKLFKVAGVISVLGIFFQNYALFFVIVPLLGTALYLVIYSYFEYEKETKKRG